MNMPYLKLISFKSFFECVESKYKKKSDTNLIIKRGKNNRRII